MYTNIPRYPLPHLESIVHKYLKATQENAITVANHDGIEISVPDEFVCPITLEPMVEPLMNALNRNFERKAILSWLSENTTCPLTRMHLRPSRLIPNRALEKRIREWRMMYDIPTPEGKEYDTVYVMAIIPSASINSTTGHTVQEPVQRNGRNSRKGIRRFKRMIRGVVAIAA